MVVNIPAVRGEFQLPVLEVLPLLADVRISRVKGTTLFGMTECEPYCVHQPAAIIITM
jgi:hypothetical protein